MTHLKEIRKSKKISGEGAAEILGVTRAYVMSYIENVNNKVIPSHNILNKLPLVYGKDYEYWCAYYKVLPDYLQHKKVKDLKGLISIMKSAFKKISKIN